MNDHDILLAIERAISAVAPEADLKALPPDADLRRELDLDSMDFLNFVIRLHDALGIDIAEKEYGRMRTLGDCLALVAEKVRAAKPEERPPPAPA
jgi:acyl carrier protein